VQREALRIDDAVGAADPLEPNRSHSIPMLITGLSRIGCSIGTSFGLAQTPRALALGTSTYVFVRTIVLICVNASAATAG
jgi:hypothetical protein